jgi:hypothetical protein
MSKREVDTSIICIFGAEVMSYVITKEGLPSKNTVFKTWV